MALSPRLNAEGSLRDVGARLAQARRDAGLNQKSMAEQLGIALWRVDDLEAGRGDVSKSVPAIARLTGRSEEWFRSPPSPQRSASSVVNPGAEARGHLVEARTLASGSSWAASRCSS